MYQERNNSVLRAGNAAQFLGIGTSTFFRWVQQGRIPKPIKLSPRCSVWRVADLQAFIEHRAAEQ